MMSQTPMTLEADSRATRHYRRNRKIHGKSYNHGCEEQNCMDSIVKESRTMPVCLSPEQLQIVEKYAKSKGMLNASQAVEELADSN